MVKKNVTKQRKKIVKPETHTIVNIESRTNTSNIELENVEGYMIERFNFTDVFDDEKLKRFIKNIEKQIRRSDAYKSFVGECHAKGLDRCAILGNVHKTDKVTIEIHHYPFTLYEIVMNCILLHISEKESFNSFTIIRDVLREHHEGIISVVPLCKTVHQLAHKGQVFIPFTSCAGDLGTYVEKYESIMDNTMKENYNELLEMTQLGISYSETDILKQIKSSSFKLDKEDISTIKILEDKSSNEERYIDEIDSDDE